MRDRLFICGMLLVVLFARETVRGLSAETSVWIGTVLGMTLALIFYKQLELRERESLKPLDNRFRGPDPRLD
jgi:uncharacterized membrane protein required for colicin V production